MEKLGQVTALVWGHMYDHDGKTLVCLSTEPDRDGDYIFAPEGDHYRRYFTADCIFAPEVEPEPEPEYLMPEVGDVIVWTSRLDFVDEHEGEYFKDIVRVELAEDQIGVVTDVSTEGVMYPAITVRHLLKAGDTYLMKPEYTITLKKGATK